MPRRPARLGMGVLAVLAIAAVVVTARSTVDGQPAGRPASPSALPVRPVAADTRFDPSAAATAGVPRGTTVVATARGRAPVRVVARPGATRVRAIVRARRIEGRAIPLTFRVRGRRAGWVRVDLPTRPNHSTGWIRRSAVRLSATRMRIVVRLRAHRLELRDGARVVLRTRAGIGRSVSPTPLGTAYVTDLVRPRDPDGFYGPYALGLSLHSPVYTSFAGGDGQVGIHGTNQPAGLGRDVSHGCIRIANHAVTTLARRVPLGAPVEIVR